MHMDDTYEISMTHRPAKGAPLRQSITCDRDLAVTWLESMLEELKSRPDSSASSDDPPPARSDGPDFQLRIGAEPQRLDGFSDR
jgi:hypothetical protein